ncbi:MAG: hypothetical protein AAF575_00220 [Bacteroidota bacterium]
MHGNHPIWPNNQIAAHLANVLRWPFEQKDFEINENFKNKNRGLFKYLFIGLPRDFVVFRTYEVIGST